MSPHCNRPRRGSSCRKPLLAFAAILVPGICVAGTPQSANQVEPLRPAESAIAFVSVAFEGSKASVTSLSRSPIVALCGFSTYRWESSLSGAMLKEAEWSANLTGAMFDLSMALRKGQTHEVAPTPVFGYLDRFVQYESFRVSGIVFANLTSAGGEMGTHCLDRFRGQMSIFRHYMKELRLLLKRKPDTVREEIRGERPMMPGPQAEAFQKTIRYYIYDQETGNLKPDAADIVEGLLQRLETVRP